MAAQAGMRWLESAYPGNARGWVGFNVPMSHKVTALLTTLQPVQCSACFMLWQTPAKNLSSAALWLGLLHDSNLRKIMTVEF